MKSSKYILLVYDDASTMEAFKIIFCEYEYLFTGFDTVDKALEHFKDHPNDFSIILTRDDPFGANALTFVNQVRKLNKKIPIIILTTRNKEHTTHDIEFNSANVSTVLELPMGIEPLIQTVEQFIK